MNHPSKQSGRAELRKEPGNRLLHAVTRLLTELGSPFRYRCLVVAVTMAACLGPVLAGRREGSAKPEFFKGSVIPLAEVLSKAGGKLDEDAAPFWLVLKTDDGKLYPLVKDDGSRMFFKDPRLLRRPMRLTGQLLPGSQMLQVVQVHSYHKNQLHELYYWCDICAIKRYENKICDCCGAQMELREVPVQP